MSGDVCVKVIIRLKMGFDPIVTGDRRRAAVHRMKIPFCRRSRLQEIRFRPASGIVARGRLVRRSATSTRWGWWKP